MLCNLINNIYHIKMKTLFCMLSICVFLFNVAVAKNNDCLAEGQYGLGGKVLGSDTVNRIKTPCCAGLVEVLEKDGCARVTGSVRYTCTKCGDKICDKKNESKCNCPEDCQKESRPLKN